MSNINERWNLFLKDFKVIAEPNHELLDKFVASQVTALIQQLASQEQLLILKALPYASLLLLQTHVNEAIRIKRKELQGD